MRRQLRLDGTTDKADGRHVLRLIGLCHIEGGLSADTTVRVLGDNIARGTGFGQKNRDIRPIQVAKARRHINIAVGFQGQKEDKFVRGEQRIGRRGAIATIGEMQALRTLIQGLIAGIRKFVPKNLQRLVARGSTAAATTTLLFLLHPSMGRPIPRRCRGRLVLGCLLFLWFVGLRCVCLLLLLLLQGLET